MPIGVYLADQIVLPLTIAGRGKYVTVPLSQHSTTHIELIKRFLAVDVCAEQLDHKYCLVHLGALS